jgi:hypothetical protein
MDKAIFIPRILFPAGEWKVLRQGSLTLDEVLGR